MTQLTLICDAGSGDRPVFPDDPPLGRRERATASRVPQLSRADAAWSSPNTRAVQTASVLGLAASLAPALRDCDYGRWTGRRLADVHREQPEALAAWIADPAAKPHGGESVTEVIGRVAGWLDEQMRERGHLVAVTHPVVIRAAIIYALGAAPSSCARIDVAPLSRTVLTHDGGSWRLRSHG
jgi:broad specificity phosphatase PhoE